VNELIHGIIVEMGSKNGKILTISVAAYNVFDCLAETLETVAIDDARLEVLIIDDGSTDETLKVAKSFEKKLPGVFRAVHKKNGGYGSTINKGVEIAQGKYFKQLDGDDGYNTENLKRLLDDLEKADTDIVFTPYLEKNMKSGTDKVIADIKPTREKSLEKVLGKADFLMMHELCFKTEMLRKNKIQIAEHRFYTDNEYVLYPVLKSKTITVLDYPIYEYKIAMQNTSTSLKGLRKHGMDFFAVCDRMMTFVKENKPESGSNLEKFTNKFLTRLFSDAIYVYALRQGFGRENYKLISEFDKKVLADFPEIYEGMARDREVLGWTRKSGYLGYLKLKAYKFYRDDFRGNLHYMIPDSVRKVVKRKNKRKRNEN